MYNEYTQAENNRKSMVLGKTESLEVKDSKREIGLFPRFWINLGKVKINIIDWERTRRYPKIALLISFLSYATLFRFSKFDL